MSDTKMLVTNIFSEIKESLIISNPIDPREREQIVGWEPSDYGILEKIGIPPLPEGKYTYVVGAESLEWPNKGCKNHHVYLMPKCNYISDLEKECYEHKLKLWKKTSDCRIWLAGFASLDEMRFTEIGPIKKNNEDDNLDTQIGGDPLPEDFQYEPHILASLYSAYDLYVNSCDCGDRYADNCAHFISNALIKAGYRLGPGAKCRCGRMIRAKELLNWVRSRPSRRFSSNHNNIRSGIWVVYQERSDGQGHILFHKEYPDEYYWRGTGDYDNWPVQWHYTF